MTPCEDVVHHTPCRPRKICEKFDSHLLHGNDYCNINISFIRSALSPTIWSAQVVQRGSKWVNNGNIWVKGTQYLVWCRSHVSKDVNIQCKTLEHHAVLERYEMSKWDFPFVPRRKSEMRMPCWLICCHGLWWMRREQEEVEGSWEEWWECRWWIGMRILRQQIVTLAKV